VVPRNVVAHWHVWAMVGENDKNVVLDSSLDESGSESRDYCLASEPVCRRVIIFIKIRLCGDCVNITSLV
jgi:hypothetical protein